MTLKIKFDDSHQFSKYRSKKLFCFFIYRFVMELDCRAVKNENSTRNGSLLARERKIRSGGQKAGVSRRRDLRESDLTVRWLAKDVRPLWRRSRFGNNAYNLRGYGGCMSRCVRRQDVEG